MEGKSHHLKHGDCLFMLKKLKITQVKDSKANKRQLYLFFYLESLNEIQKI